MAASISTCQKIFHRGSFCIRSCLTQQTVLQNLNMTAAVIQHKLHEQNRCIHTTTSMKSRYSKAYVKPLKRLDDNNTYESERLYAPVKARKTTDNVAHYHDPLVEDFINLCMSEGKRDLAKEVVAKTFERIKLIQLTKYHKATTEEAKSRIICNPHTIFHEAFNNCRPSFSFIPNIKGGVVYSVPVAANDKQSKLTAMKWIRESAKMKAKYVSFWDSLARELIEASQNQGRSARKKLDHHRRVEANRAYASYAWK